MDRDARVSAGSDPRAPTPTPPSDWPAVVAFLASAAGGIGLAVCYALGGEPQVEGALLALAFGGLGVGLIAVAHRLLSGAPRVEEREDLTAPAEEEDEVGQDLARAGVVTRRRLLGGALAASVGAIGVAALFPIRSLGPNPGTALLHTPWRAGRRAIGDDGRLVRAAAVPENGLVTVFPAGYPGSANGQAVLIRLSQRVLRRSPLPSIVDAPDGLLAFSKVCTHAGCPVGLYEAQSHQLLCPCHQSAFDVLTDARPVLGPAARALPRLPIAVDAEGFVVATGDFSAPVGPAWWSRP
jgi:ubiquinol-cytochrome c reductase iron-sulfur subunit